MTATCPSTITERRLHCSLPSGHAGRHNGEGWVWWHGNGETCTAIECRTCALNCKVKEVRRG